VDFCGFNLIIEHDFIENTINCLIIWRKVFLFFFAEKWVILIKMDSTSEEEDVGENGAQFGVERSKNGPKKTLL